MSSKKLLLITIACFVLAALIPSGGGGVPFVGPTPAEISVLIVEESGDRGILPRSQLEVLSAGAIRDYLNSHCDKVGEKPEWQILDDDIDMSNQPEKWREAMQRSRDSVPWIVISNGKQGVEGPLPETIEDTLQLLKRWGGE